MSGGQDSLISILIKPAYDCALYLCTSGGILGMTKDRDTRLTTSPGQCLLHRSQPADRIRLALINLIYDIFVVLTIKGMHRLIPLSFLN
jgi:hypothetical protein